LVFNVYIVVIDGSKKRSYVFMFVIECFKDDTNESSCTYDFFR